MSVVVVVVILASCEGYGVRSFLAKLFSLNNNFLFRHLNMDFLLVIPRVVVSLAIVSLLSASITQQ